MSNDPDLLDEECRDCWGSGLREFFSEAEDRYYEVDCATCNGDGVVLRGLH